MTKFSMGNLFRGFRRGGGIEVAVEIGTDLLKIFQVRQGRKRGKDSHLKVVRIADLKRPLFEELPPIFQSLGISIREVATYLPRKLVTLRFLEVPSTDEREISDMMRLQGIKQTPYSPEEVVLSHTVVGSRREGMSDVVLAFCQRKFVDERVDLLKRSGFKVSRVGISTEGVVDWYVSHQAETGAVFPKDLVALIDQDLSFSDVIFLRNGKFVYSKSILSGGHQVALDPEMGVERFCQEVARAIEFTMEETKLPGPKQAMLIAPLEQGDPIRAALESRLQMPVSFFNPARDSNLPAASLANSGSVTPLLGFGGHKGGVLFDMMPEDVKLGISLEKKGFQMVTTGILSLGVLAVVSLLAAGTFYNKKEYLETIEREIAKTQGYAAGIEEKLARTRVLEKIKNRDGSFLNYLKKVSGSLSPGVYFSSIDFTSEKQVVLKGFAGQMSEVFDFAKALEELKIFKGVKSERVSKKKEGEQTLAEFEIDCLL